MVNTDHSAEDALDFLDSLNENGRISYDDYSQLHDLVSSIPIIDRDYVVSFIRRISPNLHEPLATQLVNEWADDFMEPYAD